MVNLKHCVEDLKNNHKNFYNNPGSLMISKSKRVVEEFTSSSGMVTQCSRSDCTEKSCHEECYVDNKRDCYMMSNGICRGCNHSYEDHFNSAVYRRGTTVIEKVPAQELIDEYADGAKNLETVVDGIISKIEGLDEEVRDNMTKSVQYSEQLDLLALRPVGKTKLTYIDELIRMETLKPLLE